MFTSTWLCVAVLPDCLQRAVEGKAASDEEGEEDTTLTDKMPVPERKKLTGGLCNCGCQLHTHPSSGPRDSRGCCDQCQQGSEQPKKSAAFEKEKV